MRAVAQTITKLERLVMRNVVGVADAGGVAEMVVAAEGIETVR